MKRNPVLQTYLSLWADRFDDMAQGHESHPNSEGKQLTHLANECRRVVARNNRGQITAATVSRFLNDMAAKLDDMCEEKAHVHGVIGNIKTLDNIGNSSRRMASQLDRGKTNLIPQNFENAEIAATAMGLAMGSLFDLILDDMPYYKNNLGNDLPDTFFNKDRRIFPNKYYYPPIPKKNPIHTPNDDLFLGIEEFIKGLHRPVR